MRCEHLVGSQYFPHDGKPEGMNDTEAHLTPISEYCPARHNGVTKGRSCCSSKIIRNFIDAPTTFPAMLFISTSF